MTKLVTTGKLVLRKEEQIAKGKWSAEEKQKIVLAGLRNETPVAELCSQHGVSDVNVLQLEADIYREWSEWPEGKWKIKQP